MQTEIDREAVRVAAMSGLEAAYDASKALGQDEPSDAAVDTLARVRLWGLLERIPTEAEQEALRQVYGGLRPAFAEAFGY